MSLAALELVDITKRFGTKVALDGTTFTVPRGAISGLIGPNGAGKTTTFAIAAGLLVPDGGRINVVGDGPFSPQRHSGRVTMLPQDAEFPAHLPVRETLTYLARLGGQSRAEASRSTARALDQVALSDRADARPKHLSHGMRRRLTVAQALLGDPELVMLDEPTSGLDPELVVQMRELFASQRKFRTLVISSHNLQELEALCDHVVFLERGRCIKSGSMTEVTQRGTRMTYHLETVVAIEPLQAECPDLSFGWDQTSLVVDAPKEWTPARVNDALLTPLLAAGAKLIEIHRGRTLEQAYLDREQA